VIRVYTDKPNEAEPVVTGFPTEKFGEKPTYKIGPLGLEFITRTKLAVGTGGLAAGEDVVQVYALPQELAAIDYDKAEYHVGPIPAGGRSKNGEGNFFGVAKIPEDDSEKGFFVSSAADKEKGWVLKSGVAANRLGDLQPFLATQQATGVGNPTAVVVNPKPRSRYLVVAQMGGTDDERDSVIGFYGPASGEPALVEKTGLYDITGLAYSPTGDLYATDFAWARPAAGGVYRLEAAEVEGRQSCRAVKIAAAMRPTALTFTPDGSLYMTAMGERNSVDEAPTGVLLKIAPREGTPKL
jgi:hypothetical protein